MAYWGNVSKSFKLLYKNPLIFLPDFCYILLSIALLLLTLSLTGLLSIVNKQEALKAFVENLLKDPSQVVYLGLIFGVYILISFFIKAFFTSFRYSLIKSVIKNKKVQLKNNIKEGKDYYLSVLLLQLAVFAIILIPFIIIGSFLYTGLNTYLILILSLVTGFILACLFLFRYATLFLKTRGTWKVLFNCWNYFKKNKLHTILVLLSLIIINCGFLIVFGIISFIPIIWFAMGLRSILSLIVSLWSEVFIFLNY